MLFLGGNIYISFCGDLALFHANLATTHRLCAASCLLFRRLGGWFGLCHTYFTKQMSPVFMLPFKYQTVTQWCFWMFCCPGIDWYWSTQRWWRCLSSFPAQSTVVAEHPPRHCSHNVQWPYSIFYCRSFKCFHRVKSSFLFSEPQTMSHQRSYICS